MINTTEIIKIAPNFTAFFQPITKAARGAENCSLTFFRNFHQFCENVILFHSASKRVKMTSIS